MSAILFPSLGVRTRGNIALVGDLSRDRARERALDEGLIRSCERGGRSDDTRTLGEGLGRSCAGVSRRKLSSKISSFGSGKARARSGDVGSSLLGSGKLLQGVPQEFVGANVQFQGAFYIHPRLVGSRTPSQDVQWTGAGTTLPRDVLSLRERGLLPVARSMRHDALTENHGVLYKKATKFLLFQ